ncbi:hypothetical protein SMD20_06095 [Nonomuraea sp. LP-02]|uniref:hypothetical protein n=1 Tax=Nonomuraea sp. LP-02 TaxID=3097960 RepID=UPI002E32B4A8|nr:hypothetical protein [Nonomuraea sp. LP-02]MED7923791.1 hypothetical protein [Nonomuraea sp. LP-02]
MVAPDLRRPLVRALAEAEGPRRYWHTADEAGRVWLFESVEGGDGEQWAIRQVEVGADRAARRYWWEHLQDEQGFLTDQPLEIWDLTEIPGAAFDSVWEAAG